MISINKKFYISIFSLFFGTTAISVAEQQPTLELGLGVGGINIPHYRGSDQTEQYIVPFPYVKYTSKRLNIDREGGRYFLYDFENSKLDISLDFALPVNSGNNRARESMPDLKAIIEVGPRLLFYPYTSEDKAFRVRLGLPLRMAFATNISETESAGFTFSPYIQFRYFNYTETALTIGPFWATEQYHDYFYQIDPEFVTAQRALYDAKGGYGGTKIQFASSKRFKRIWAGIFARYYILNGAVYQDSPLVKQKTSFLVGFGISYIFKSGNK